MIQDFVWPVRVYYKDTDAGGVVYHARYLHFLERARTEWLRSLNFEQDSLVRDLGTLFVVRTMKLDYLRPAHFNEQLLVRSKITELRRVSMNFAQNIHLTNNNALVLIAQVQIVCIDATQHRPSPIPEQLLKAIRNEL